MNTSTNTFRKPWNQGKLVGQKSPLHLKDILAIGVRLQLAGKICDLSLFNLSVDSKLRACDLIKLRACNIARGKSISSRAIVIQEKTKRPVQFETTEQTQKTVIDWIQHARLRSEDYLFPSRLSSSDHLSTTACTNN